MVFSPIVHVSAPAQNQLRPLRLTLFLILKQTYHVQGTEREALTTIQNSDRLYLLRMPTTSACDVQHVPQNGPVNFGQTVSVFSAGSKCCDQQVIHFFLTASVIQVVLFRIDQKAWCKYMPPSIVRGNSSTLFFSVCVPPYTKIEFDIFLLFPSCSQSARWQCPPCPCQRSSRDTS